MRDEGEGELSHSASTVLQAKWIPIRGKHKYFDPFSMYSNYKLVWSYWTLTKLIQSWGRHDYCRKEDTLQLGQSNKMQNYFWYTNFNMQGFIK